MNQTEQLSCGEILPVTILRKNFRVSTVKSQKCVCITCKIDKEKVFNICKDVQGHLSKRSASVFLQYI